MTISLILPVYNVSKYLDRCLEAICSQAPYLNMIEIIMVDDCSKDNSTSIIKLWANKYSNFKIVTHQINKGLGAARNTGLKYASGDYIWFIDTDDYVSYSSLSRIFEVLIHSSPDVLKFNFLKENNQHKLINENLNPDFKIFNISGYEYLVNYYQPASMSACSNVYKRKYLLEKGLFFQEGVFWEDADVVLKSYLLADDFYYMPENLYYYCYNQSSISRNLSSKKIIDLLKMAVRKNELMYLIPNEELRRKVLLDVIWNLNAIKKIILLDFNDLIIFFIVI